MPPNSKELRQPFGGHTVPVLREFFKKEQGAKIVLHFPELRRSHEIGAD